MEHNQELPKTFLDGLGGELNPPSISSEQVAKLMRDASIDSRRLNDLLRQVTMGVVGKIPAIGSVVSAMVGFLYPEETGLNSKLNALEAKLTEKIEKAVDEQHVKDIKSHIQNLTHAANELQTALYSVQKGSYYDGSVKDIHATLREKAENVDKKFKELVPFLMQEGHEIGDLPVYTKVAAAHILFLNYMKKRGTDSKLYRYDSSNTVDAQFQPAGKVNTYAKHIEETFKKGDDGIVKLIQMIDDKKAELKALFPPGVPIGLGNASKANTLEKQIAGLNDLQLEKKRSLYRDLTVTEGSFETASGRELMYTHFTDILNGTYKIVSKLDHERVLDNDYNHGRMARLNIDRDTYTGEKWTFQYNKTKKAYKIISAAANNELAVNGQTDSVFATDDRRLDSDPIVDLRYWKVEDAGNGYVFIKNLKTGRVLDVTDGKTDPGTDIKTHTKNVPAVAAQLFRLIDLD
ncbi:RICIN domain-containing protein [Bacillus thuringiensis]|nr:RICIN domain-containing protein [Bacillus thuringiensis]MED2756081.1 RICIN domain-containing protein [Bacillus thuringiensis]MED2766463.1 RICIN domain-containing protein [Bacillus thuringiensis]MED2773489.1 RICIN domain-containing protein [Bacillus thuringiensis]MED2779369.1 RICIN domain-containing protein [Bacillus thuringiensis]